MIKKLVMAIFIVYWLTIAYLFTFTLSPNPEPVTVRSISPTGDPSRTWRRIGLGLSRVEADRKAAEAAAEQARRAAEAEQAAARAAERARTARQAPRSTQSAPQASQARSAPSGGASGMPAGCIRKYESGGTTDEGGNYSAGGGGAYQIIPSTWDGYGGYSRAEDAPQSVQDAKAQQLWAEAGRSHWAAQRGRCF